MSRYNKKKYCIAKTSAGLSHRASLRENKVQTKSKRTDIWNCGWEKNMMAYCGGKAFLKCRAERCGQQLSLGLNSFADPGVGGQS